MGSDLQVAGLAARQAGRDRSPRVMYVGGFGRSGSTLVGRVLAEAPGAICVGETCYLLSRGLGHNVDCGCGVPFRECVFWEAVGRTAFGGWEQLDSRCLIGLEGTTTRLRALPRHWLSPAGSRFAAAIGEYGAFLGRVYRAIAEVSGARLIIETSKDANFASILTRTAGLDVRIVHLVRDPRAVAYSWTRRRRLASPIGTEQHMPTFTPASTARRWLAANTGFHLISRRAAYHRLAYERFVEHPERTLATLERFAGFGLHAEPPQLAAGRVRLGEHHIFSGNPMRARSGWIELRTDDEWRSKLPPRERLHVTAVTAPLLARYGYPFSPTRLNGPETR